MRLHVIVLTYRQDTFDQHLKYWEAHNAPITVICPEGFTAKTNHPVIHRGKPGHEGPEAHKRSLAIMDVALKSEADHVIVYEHDSICLDVSSIRWKRGFFGNVFISTDPEFISPRYSNPPWIIDRMSLWAMNAQEVEFQFYEQGFNDRYLSALAHAAGVPIFDHIPRGYTQGTIEWYWHGWELMRQVARGGTMIHGIKTPEMLQKIEEVYANRDILRTLGCPPN